MFTFRSQRYLGEAVIFAVVLLGWVVWKWVG